MFDISREMKNINIKLMAFIFEQLFKLLEKFGTNNKTCI